MSQDFPEDSLTLLGPEVSSLDAFTFYARVLSFYAERVMKTREPKAPVLKGKITQTATKKRNGTYEISLSGVLLHKVSFTKDKRITDLTEVTYSANVIKFLTAKKFLLDETILT